MSDSNVFSEIQAQAAAVKTQEELEELVNSVLPSLNTHIASVGSQISKLAPMAEVTKLKITSLPSVLTYAQKLQTQIITPQVKPYITMATQISGQLAAISSVHASVSAAIARVGSDLRLPDLPTLTIPDLTLPQDLRPADVATMLATPAAEGDYATLDNGAIYQKLGTDTGTLADWTQINRDFTGADVGLGNVANIAPQDLPISTAVQAQLDLLTQAAESGKEEIIFKPSATKFLFVDNIPSPPDQAIVIKAYFFNLPDFTPIAPDGETVDPLQQNPLVEWTTIPEGIVLTPVPWDEGSSGTDGSQATGPGSESDGVSGQAVGAVVDIVPGESRQLAVPDFGDNLQIIVIATCGSAQTSVTIDRIDQTSQQLIDDANATLAIVEAFADDGIVSKFEKLTLLPDIDQINSDYTKYLSQATYYITNYQVDLVNERDNLITTHTALVTYLAGTTIADSSVDSPVVRADFDNAFATYNTAETVLIAKMFKLAATVADWVSIYGDHKPADDADVTAHNIAAGFVGQGLLSTLDAVDFDAFAAGIEPIGLPTGNTLPTVKTTTTIYFQGKFYKWDDTLKKYVPLVNFVDVAGTVIGDQIADAAINTAKFAQGIEPVTIWTGGSLPVDKTTTSLFFNGKLYKWDGTKYTAVVNTDDLEGAIKAGQIDPGAVSITAFADGIEPVMLITDDQLPLTKVASVILFQGKLYRWDDKTNQYTTNVAANDIVGSIVGAQIADAALTTAKFAASIDPVTIVSGNQLPGERLTSAILFQNKLYYWNGTKYTTEVAAVDISGTLLGDQIADGQLEASHLAAGIEPIGMPTGDNLPTVKTTNTIFFKGKLYKWNGTAYDSNVLSTDIVGSILGTQIADAALTTAKFAQGIEPVGIITGTTLPTVKTTTTIIFGGKLYRWDNTLGAYTANLATSDLLGQVQTAQIANDAIIQDKIADAAINTSKFAQGIEPVGIILDATLPTVKSTTTIYWQNKLYRWDETIGAYTANVLASDVSGTILAGQIADASLTTAKFAQGIEPVGIITGDTLPTEKTTSTILFGGKIYRWDGTKYTNEVATTDLSGYVTTTQIAPNAVTADKIADQAVSLSAFADGLEPVGVITGTVLPTERTTSSIFFGGKLYHWDGTKYTTDVAASDVTGQITADQLADNSITSTKLAEAVIDATKFAAGVEPIGIIDGNVLPTVKTTTTIVFDSKLYRWDETTGKYTSAVAAIDLTGSIQTSQIEPGAVTSDLLAAGAVDISAFATGIEPMQVFTSGPLPTVKTTSAIFYMETLYRWDSTAGAYTSTVSSVHADDIIGQLAGSQISDAAIAASKFAPGLEPVTIIDGNVLPTVKTTSTISFQSKLYRWDGTKYTASVATVDLSGTITGDQIAAGSISTFKFASGIEPVSIVSSGPLPTVKTTAALVYNNKLYRWDTTLGAYTAEVLAADLVGTIAAAAIAASTIDATKFASGIEPVTIVDGTDLPVTKSTSTIFFGGKLYRWDGSKYTTTVAAVDVDARGLSILDSNGLPVFGSDGYIGPTAQLNINGNNVLLSDVAANALTPSLHYVGDYDTAPTPTDLGDNWKQNSVYKNNSDGKSYVLTGLPLAWELYLADGVNFSLVIESTNGTTFRVGQGTSTTLKGRLFKNGAEVTDVTPAGWFRWRRVSGIPREAPNDDATWNALYMAGYTQIDINVDSVYARATFFCDIISS